VVPCREWTSDVEVVIFPVAGVQVVEDIKFGFGKQIGDCKEQRIFSQKHQ